MTDTGDPPHPPTPRFSRCVIAGLSAVKRGCSQVEVSSVLWDGVSGCSLLGSVEAKAPEVLYPRRGSVGLKCGGREGASACISVGVGGAPTGT